MFQEHQAHSALFPEIQVTEVLTCILWMSVQQCSGRLPSTGLLVLAAPANLSLVQVREAGVMAVLQELLNGTGIADGGRDQQQPGRYS